jgi:hypothetical protein
LSDWIEELAETFTDREMVRIRDLILRIEASKGIQKSASRLLLNIANSMLDAGIAMKKLGLIPADEDMPLAPLIQIVLNCIENGTADRIWADPRRGPKHPDPDVIWGVWGQVKVANQTMGLRPSSKSVGAFETVAQIRAHSRALPWEPDTIEKYYKRCQRIWKDVKQE